jgi:biuret amidohydrolase
VPSPDAVSAFKMLARNPAVVTIDLHRGHLDPSVATLPLPAPAAQAVTANAIALLDELRAWQAPVIHVITSYRSREEIVSNPYWAFQADRPGSPRRAVAEHNLDHLPGVELMPGIMRSGDIVVATKKRYDCFVGTDLEFILRSGGHDSVILLGVNTNSCVLATAIAASVRDFAVFVVEEAVDSMLGPVLHRAALDVLDASFGWSIGSNEVARLIKAARERKSLAVGTS